MVTVRSSHRGAGRAIHLVSAYGGGLGMVLGQVRTADKSSEITAIPELPDALLLKGAIVTIDAMGCQRSIATRILAAGAGYVLAVKENQPGLLARMRTSLDAPERFEGADGGAAMVSEYREVDKGMDASGHAAVWPAIFWPTCSLNLNCGPACVRS